MAMTIEQQRAMAMAEAKMRAAQGTQEGDWSPEADANLAEKISGTGTFADMTGSGIAKAIPFGDEIVSGANAPFRAGREWLEGQGFDIPRAYDRNMQVEAELQKRREDRSPIASTAGAVAGGVGAAAPLAAGGLSFLQGAKATLPSLVGRGAAEGAAYGTAYGAGEGRGLNERLYNAGMGGVAGGVTGGAMGSLARVGAAKRASVPSLEELQSAKNAAYDATDALGIQYKPEAFADMVSYLVKEAKALKINPARHPKAVSILQDMADDVKAGHAPTLRQLDEQRQIIYRDIGKDEAEQFFGNRIIKKIDDFVDNAKVGDALTGDPDTVAPAIKQARELNRRYRNSQRLDEALVKAERRAASSNSGGNVENAKRQNVRRLLDNESSARFLNDAEKQAYEKVVRGTTGQNATRAVGNWAKGFGGHSLAGGSVAASIMTGNPLPLAGAVLPYAAGSGLKAISRGLGNANEQLAESLVRTGSVPMPELDALRRALIETMSRSSGQQLPGYISP